MTLIGSKGLITMVLLSSGLLDENLTDMEIVFGKGHWGEELYGYNHQIFVPLLVSKIENRKLIIIGAEMPWEILPPNRSGGDVANFSLITQRAGFNGFCPWVSTRLPLRKLGHDIF